MSKIDSAELLEAIDREIRDRLNLTPYQRDEYGWGYDCCGCSSPSMAVHDVEEIIGRLAAHEDKPQAGVEQVPHGDE